MLVLSALLLTLLHFHRSSVLCSNSQDSNGNHNDDEMNNNVIAMAMTVHTAVAAMLAGVVGIDSDVTPFPEEIRSM